MDLPCSCNESGKDIFQTLASSKGHKSAPLDEILQLHQNVHLLGSGIRECLGCCTNDDVMAALLDGLATLSTLYEAAHIQYSKTSAPGDVTCDTPVQIHPAAYPFPGNSTAPPDETHERLSGHHVHPTLRAVPDATPVIVLGRIELTEFETSLVAVTVIKQGLSQTGSHLRDLQQHLTKCLMVKKMQKSNYDVYTRRVGEILNAIYASLAGI
ncbi:hypothetical protein BU25DRAFT_166901 [Macroventuria anomochaeta]|uniref:Uncharacterized protein n=1 Tax=Macroventuria anomochaeta TaxID=301207 RepID=A0ACB6RSH0_9PLEO|nr:uncharacterized protein BU25DRAFT_166901 [Macroventuria anomochaeta]KAF2624089.1 hypothetical protein BU25DRAFT_166901 [Macroventuria anomochaeta]